MHVTGNTLWGRESDGVVFCRPATPEEKQKYSNVAAELPAHRMPEDVDERIARHERDLLKWERSGERGKWERECKLLALTVAERIAASRKVSTHAASMLWVNRDGEWSVSHQGAQSLPDKAVEVSFVFTEPVDKVTGEGGWTSASGRTFHLRQALDILEKQKQSGKWASIEVIPETVEGRVMPVEELTALMVEKGMLVFPKREKRPEKRSASRHYKVCQCKRRFLAKRSNQQFCSPKCRKSHWAPNGRETVLGANSLFKNQ